MGGHLSSGSRPDQDARLLALLDEFSPSLAALGKRLRKGANYRSAVYPGLLPSRQSSMATMTPANPPQWSALMRAAYRGHKQVVQLLLQQGAPLGLQAADGVSALMVS